MVKAPAKRVLNDNQTESNAVAIPCPLLYCGRPEGREISLQIPMVFEGWPEDVGHREHYPYERYVGKRYPLLPLPEQGASIATAWAGLRFAGVEEDLLFRCRCIDFAP